MISEPQTAESAATAGRERSILEIPPDPSSIKTARLFAAAVARHFAFSDAAVEDVRLAVSEAVTSAVRAHGLGGLTSSISISAELVGASLHFEVASAAPPPDIPLEGRTPPGGLYEGSLGLAIIESLFDDSAVARTSDGGTLVTFSLSLLTTSEADD